MIRSVVHGCGAYLPERVLTNAELATTVDTSAGIVNDGTLDASAYQADVFGLSIGANVSAPITSAVEASPLLIMLSATDSA